MSYLESSPAAASAEPFGVENPRLVELFLATVPPTHLLSGPNWNVLFALSVATAVAYVIWTQYLRPLLESKKPFPDIPMPPQSHWLLGHFGCAHGNKFAANFQTFFSNHSDDKGRTGVWFGSTPILVLANWKDGRAVLQAEYTRVINYIARVHVDQHFGRRNILVLKGKDWRYHRSAVQKSFTRVALNKARDCMLQVIETVTCALKAKLAVAGSLEMDVDDLMKMITLDIFGLSAFSHEFGCCQNLEPSPIAHAFNVLGDGFNRRVTTNPIHPLNVFYGLPTDENRKHNEAKRVIRAFVDAAVRERLEEQQQETDYPAKSRDLLSNLLAGHDMAKEELKYDKDVSEETLSDITLTLLFAGYDTTSTALAYALYLISQHPQVEANCLEEIAAGAQLDTDEAKLVYCKAVLYETLRLYPSAPSTSRTLQKAVRLPDGYIIPKGTTVSIPIWAVHRREDNFPFPLEFLPERWARRQQPSTNGRLSSRWVERDPNEPADDSTGGVPAANRNAFFAFSQGGRSCPGQKYAWEEATLVLSGLLKSFRFRALDNYVLCPERAAAIQRPRGGLPMTISIR